MMTTGLMTISGEKMLLLDSLILNISIGIEPNEGNAFQNFFQKIIGIDKHYSCFLKLSGQKEDEGIILEYFHGFPENQPYKNYTYYGEHSSDGIRFSKMSFEDYEKIIHKGLHKGLSSQIISSFIVVNNKMTLRKLIEECNSKSEKKWSIEDHNASSHNCKHFILKVIEVLKVTRDTSTCLVFRYNIRHALFPPEILSALESNESEEVRNRNEIEPTLLKKLFNKIFS